LQEFENIDIIEGTVEDVLDSLLDAGEQYNAAVIDPPSRGLSKVALDNLMSLNIPKLVYVSGDVASFARDAKQFALHGYELQRVQPFDFAPQTYYVETVSLFVKS